MDLEALSTHIAIRQQLATYCRAVDRKDVAMLKSVYHPDATDDHGVFRGNGHDFADWLVAEHGKLSIVGQHHVTNIYIEIDPDGAAASVESYYVAYNPFQADDGREIIMPTGGRYLDRFEQRDGAWRIARRVCTVEWSRTEMTGATWEGQRHFALAGPRGEDVSDAYFGPDRADLRDALSARLAEPVP